MASTEGNDHDDLRSQARSAGLSDSMIETIVRCSEFHTYPAPGLLIGVFMVERALAELGASPSEKLFSVAETKKCLPDALQVIAHCTIGNNRLRVLHAGRFALTMNRPSLESSAEAVRVFLDEERMKALPTFYAWFMHDPNFDKRTMVGPLMDEILHGTRDCLQVERVRVRVTQRTKWDAGRCSCCGEPVPDNLLVDGICALCRDEPYYDSIA